jgi:hypothetical protein
MEKKLCLKLDIYKDYSEMLHGQQNIELRNFYNLLIDQHMHNYHKIH